MVIVIDIVSASYNGLISYSLSILPIQHSNKLFPYLFQINLKFS